MNKAELSLKWSKYCDTDKLVDDMMALLKEYQHNYSEHGVCVLLDTYFTQKEPLIQLAMTSKHYIGDLRIAVQKEFDRRISSYEVDVFFRDIKEKLDAEQLLQYTNAEGKTLDDYIRTDKKVLGINDLPGAKEQDAKMKNINKFNLETKATVDSAQRYYGFLYYMDAFRYTPYSKLNRDIGGINDPVLLKKGTKTSRAFNTICSHYGVDKFNPQPVESVDENGNVSKRIVYPYNKVLASYSDLVSDLARKMYFVISLNPLDYLMMSNGVSWKSCHNIRDGSYKGGCLSYMLDGTSMVTFVVSDLNAPIHKNLRFYRQMFHYDNGLFMQNRLYPQGNDGAVNLYDKFRGFMMEEFAALLNDNGDWSVETGSRTCRNHTRSRGAHYTDYHYNDSCGIFYPNSKANTIRDRIMTVGHNGICAKCGREYTTYGRLSHQRGEWDCVVG